MRKIFNSDIKRQWILIQIDILKYEFIQLLVNFYNCKYNIRIYSICTLDVVMNSVPLVQFF